MRQHGREADQKQVEDRLDLQLNNVHSQQGLDQDSDEPQVDGDGRRDGEKLANRSLVSPRAAGVVAEQAQADQREHPATQAVSEGLASMGGIGVGAELTGSEDMARGWNSLGEVWDGAGVVSLRTLVGSEQGLGAAGDS